MSYLYEDVDELKREHARMKQALGNILTNVSGLVQQPPPGTSQSMLWYLQTIESVCKSALSPEE